MKINEMGLEEVTFEESKEIGGGFAMAFFLGLAVGYLAYKLIHKGSGSSGSTEVVSDQQ